MSEMVYSQETNRSLQKRPSINQSPLRSMFSKAIKDSGMTKMEIARRSGLSQTTVVNLLNGVGEGRIETWELMLAAAGVRVGIRKRKSD